MTTKEKIIKMYLLGKYKSKNNISNLLGVKESYVKKILKEFNENTVIKCDFGVCQSLTDTNKFYLFSSSGIEKTLILFTNAFYSECELSYSEKNFIKQNTGYKVYESKESLFRLSGQ